MTSAASHHIKPMSDSIAGVAIPDSRLAREVTELVRDTEPPLLFHHSSRVYYWGALTGGRRGLRFDPELLYPRINSCRPHANSPSRAPKPRPVSGKRS